MEIKNKNILVTGGAGFIGSNLVKELYNLGNNIIVLDNFSSGFRKNLDPYPNVTIVSGDIRDRDTVDSCMKNIDMVFHLAASVGLKRSINFPVIDAEINIVGTLNILESMRKYDIKKIVVSSSASVYGEPKSVPIKEEHPTNPDSPYACTKLCEENLSMSYSKIHGLNVTCLRYFNVYGPNQRFDAYGSVIPIFVHQSINKNPITIYGDGNQTRDFVHVNDVVQANLKAAVLNVNGSFNVGSGVYISINELANIISETMGNNNIIHIEKRKGDVTDSISDITLIKEKLLYNPQSDLKTEIKNYINWVVNDNLL